MQKPLTSHRQGHCGKTRFNQILPQAKPKNQVSRISELSNYIRLRQLTDALELLEKSSITGDLAIFTLANLQSWGVRA